MPLNVNLLLHCMYFINGTNLEAQSALIRHGLVWSSYAPRSTEVRGDMDWSTFGEVIRTEPIAHFDFVIITHCYNWWIGHTAYWKLWCRWLDLLLGNSQAQAIRSSSDSIDISPLAISQNSKPSLFSRYQWAIFKLFTYRGPHIVFSIYTLYNMLLRTCI